MTRPLIFSILSLTICFLLLPGIAGSQGTIIRIDSREMRPSWGSYGTSAAFEPSGFLNQVPDAIPEWALLQRELLRSTSSAAEYFYHRYFDERGYLKTDMRWGANDGPDDAIENVNRWPELHALGGSDRIRDLYKKAYEGHIRQMSEPPRTITGRPTHVPFNVDGMYYKEFPTKMDWMHNSEGLIVFNMMGLSNPDDLRYIHRTRRFAGFYTGENPGAPNYDPEHRIIRSLFNGSRGPLMRRATAVDWVGDPSEIRNRYDAGHSEGNYEEFLFHFKDYHDTLGDNPLNLLSTSLALNAFTLTGEERYRNWLLEYVDAWYDRMEQNGWLIPSNIGLDGTIGGETEGRWYGGAYGWSFTIDHQSPPGNRLAHRQRPRWGFVGFMNAYMLTGDDRYLDAWRKQDDVIYQAGKMINGIWHTPWMYGNPNWSREGFTDQDGWYDFQPGRAQDNMLELYFLSMKPEDRVRVENNAWLDYLEGNNPEYAVNAMRADLEDVKRRMELIHQDGRSADMKLADDPMNKNPASISSLIRLMGGGLYIPRRAPLFFTRLRYFDFEERRAGVPEDVAVLVEGMTDTTTLINICNISAIYEREVVVQGGGYGEHQILSVEVDGDHVEVNDNWFRLRLAPGTGTRMVIHMQRHVNQPAAQYPWNRN